MPACGRGTQHSIFTLVLPTLVQTVLIYKRVYFPFHVVGSQGGKSSPNPKAPAFSTSGNNSPTRISYANAATRNMTSREGMYLSCLRLPGFDFHVLFADFTVAIMSNCMKCQ
jgi:hypothetical protein